MKRTGQTTGFPLVIGAVIAAASITQDNYGGAVFAVLVGAGASLVLHVKRSR
ncbi:hypothetical protein ACFW9D_22685 [Streptomyces sp. NPDC059524]|uniref:hypothetical protein n=1 Tax=Streptomyces sp. NPDC059524 TaxID=3346856 RepID=UPI0036CBC3A2